MMEETSWNGSKFVRTTANQKRFHRFNTQLGLRLHPFGEWFSLQITPFSIDISAMETPIHIPIPIGESLVTSLLCINHGSFRLR